MKAAIEIEKQRKFTSEYDYGAFSVVRIHPVKVREIGGRNTWVKITSECSTIFRMVMGAKSSSGFTHKAMEIDYDSCLELDCITGEACDEDGFYACTLKIEKANKKEIALAHWKHPNPAYRVPMQLGIVGFVLGVIGLLLGIMGYA